MNWIQVLTLVFMGISLFCSGFAIGATYATRAFMKGSKR